MITMIMIPGPRFSAIFALQATASAAARCARYALPGDV